MSVGLDTSVVLRLLTGTPPEQAASAGALVAEADTPVSISDLVIAETYFALRHHYAVPHGSAVRAMAELLADPRIGTPGIGRAVLLETTARGSARTKPGVIDLLIHADYARDGLDLVTFDRELGRVPGVRVLST